jgi:exosortase family protein XrtF
MKELKPAFRFLAVFVGLYIVLNVLYGLWIASYGNRADALTELVTDQTSFLLNVLGEDTFTRPKPNRAAISIVADSNVVLSVFEGCNSINVMIVFVSFVFAFGGERKKIAWFLPLGMGIVYVANLIRVMVLYFVAAYWKEYFYYMHKYVLTALLYLIVFILWWWWIEKVSGVSIRKAMTNQ